MKKLLAMLLVLMLALPCAALAEPSTAYTIAFKNPVLTMTGESLDMTGLDLELSALVSDVGQFAVTALVNVGPNFENNALSAQAQLDANGLTFTADGMSNVYSFDLTQFTNGFDVTTLLPMLPIYSLLKQPIEMDAAAIDMSVSARFAAISELFGQYAANGAISIDRTQGELLINQLLTSIETAASSMDVEGIAELREMRPAFDMTGSLTGSDQSYTLAGEGQLYAGESDEALRYDITLTDSAEAFDGVINLYEPEGSEVVTITIDSDSTAADNGRTAVNTSAVLTMTDTEDASVNEELMTITYTATPEAGSPKMEYVAAMDLPTEDTNVTLAVSTGTNGDDIGFAIDLFANADGSSGNGFLYYTGAKTVDELGTAFDGHFSIGADIDGESAKFETDLLLRDTAMDTADWAYDSTGAIDVEKMDETQSTTAMMGLMGIAGTALGLISQHVPGLAPLLGSMMG